MELGTVLVTGAGGFIGRHLVAHLREQGARVRVMLRRPAAGPPGALDTVVGDVRDAWALEKATLGVDTIFHLAAKVHDLAERVDRGEHDDITVKGTRLLLRAATANGVRRLVFFSSLNVYGAVHTGMVDETTPPVPDTAYGRAKLQAEQEVLAAGRPGAVHVCCLRPAVVYGSGAKGYLPRMARMIERGLFPPLPHLESVREMVHVSNLLQAALLAAGQAAAAQQVYNVTDGEAYSVGEIYATICRGVGRPVPRWHVPLGALRLAARAGDALGSLLGRRVLFDGSALARLTASTRYSSEKIRRELGYEPRVRLADRVTELIASY